MIILDYFPLDYRTMYTGIIEDLGTVEAVEHFKEGAAVTIRTALPTAKINLGDSISVSGACLTVTAKGRGTISRGTISMDVSAETLRRTTLGRLKIGDRVNLERCLTLSSPIGGHLVAGHVDGVGKLVSIKPEGDSRLCTFEAPVGEARYLIEKGSVTLDGVSLTVFGIRNRRFSCALIPATLKLTTLGAKKPGEPVNIESDMLGKYVEKFVAARAGIGAVNEG
jgi:riboflavin synthase